MNKYFTLIFLLSLFFLFSCRSSKELIYLNDVATDGKFKGLPKQTTEHILNPGDILYVSIKSMNAEVNALFNPESNMEVSNSQGVQKFLTPSGAYLYGFEIDADGIIKLPMLGNLKVDGVSVADVETIIQKKTDEYINDAIVKVKLLNFTVTVIGEVKSPGVYFSYKNTLTVIEALAMANGNTDFATIKKVMVIRHDQDGYESFLLDLNSKEIFLSRGFYLSPNDYVVVQPDKFKNLQLNSPVYSLVFSSLSMLLAIVVVVLR